MAGVNLVDAGGSLSSRSPGGAPWSPRPWPTVRAGSDPPPPSRWAATSGCAPRRLHLAQVDRYILDCIPELWCQLDQPGHHRRGCAPCGLRSAPATTAHREVDDPGVPRVDPHPATGLGALLPPRLGPPGLVDAQHPHRLALQPLRVRDERPVHRRPRQMVGGGDLEDRARSVADSRTDLIAQPAGRGRPGRNPADGLGGRTARTIVLPTTSPGLVLPQNNSVLPVEDVLRVWCAPGPSPRWTTPHKPGTPRRCPRRSRPTRPGCHQLARTH